MPHVIPSAQPFKKGDRVQHTGTGWLATVTEDQTEDIVLINWDKNPEPNAEAYRAGAFRIAPWHELPFDTAGSIEDGKVTETDLRKPIHRIGDRVKLKYNRSGGTVKANAFRGDRTVPVEWDKAPGIKAIEELADLVVLYAPRDDDPVNPNQEAIDAIEVQRDKLKKEVEALQQRLGTLTAAKRLLERG